MEDNILEISCNTNITDKVSLLEMMVSSTKEHGRQEILILVKSPIMMVLITLDKSE